MNTSAIGARYERAYKNAISPKCWWVVRSAASKGPFDLVASFKGEDAVRCIQLKRGYLSCKAADALMTHLWNRFGMPSYWYPYVVHKTKAKEFCEH